MATPATFANLGPGGRPLQPMQQSFIGGGRPMIAQPQINSLQAPQDPIDAGVTPPIFGSGIPGVQPITTDGPQIAQPTIPFDPNIQPQGQIEPGPRFAPTTQFGLAGGEQALQAGLQGGLGALQAGTQAGLGTLFSGFQAGQQQLQQGIGALGGIPGITAGQGQAVQIDPNTGQPLFQQGISGVQAFSPAGLQAQQVQAALSGALGQEAFEQALATSPQQAFLNRLGQEAVVNQAAATGGVGGGEVLRDLQQLGQAQASQRVQQQIQNLQALSGQGLQAAGQAGQLLGQAGGQQAQLTQAGAQLGTQASLANAAARTQASIAGAQLQGQQARAQAGLFGQGANLAAQLAQTGAGFQQQRGLREADLFGQASRQLFGGRVQAGRDIAGQVAATTGGLSQLAAQQGSGLAGILGSGTLNVANLQTAAAQAAASGNQQLAAILANLATQQGSQVTNLALQGGQVGAQAALAQGQIQTDLLGNLVGAAGAGGLLTP